MDLPVEEVIEALIQYYEAAGFSDFYNRVLKEKTEQELQLLYRQTYCLSTDD